MARKEEVVINDKIFSSIKKLELNDGATLLFQIQTDDQGLPYIDLDVISKVLMNYGYDLSVRAENLSVEIFVSLSNSLCKREF